MMGLTLHPSIKFDASFFDAIGMTTLKYHWQGVLLSTAVCCVIFEASRLLSPLLFPKTFQFFKGVSRKNAAAIHMRNNGLWWIYSPIGSSICLCSSIMLPTGMYTLYLLFTVWSSSLDPSSLCRMKYWRMTECLDTLLGRLIFTLSLVGKLLVERGGVGFFTQTNHFLSHGRRYFLWDTFVALNYVKYQGISMVCHGIASFAVFIFSYVSPPGKGQPDSDVCFYTPAETVCQLLWIDLPYVRT